MSSVRIYAGFTKKMMYSNSCDARVFTRTSTWMVLGRFEETRLPPQEAFYSKLNMEGISDKDYEHAQQVCKRTTPEAEMVTLGGLS